MTNIKPAVVCFLLRLAQYTCIVLSVQPRSLSVSHRATQGRGRGLRGERKCFIANAQLAKLDVACPTN